MSGENITVRKYPPHKTIQRMADTRPQNLPQSAPANNPPLIAMSPPPITPKITANRAPVNEVNNASTGPRIKRPQPPAGGCDAQREKPSRRVADAQRFSHNTNISRAKIMEIVWLARTLIPLNPLWLASFLLPVRLRSL